MWALRQRLAAQTLWSRAGPGLVAHEGEPGREVVLRPHGAPPLPPICSVHLLSLWPQPLGAPGPQHRAIDAKIVQRSRLADGQGRVREWR